MKPSIACGVLLLLTGCTTFLPDYIPDAEARAARPTSYDPPILHHAPSRSYIVIGHTSFATWLKRDEIDRALKTLARQHGADAILISQGAEENREVPFTVPTTVEMRSVTTQQTGTATVTGPYGGTVQGNYAGTQTTSVPVVNPGYSGTQSRRVTNFYAYFIVFNRS